MTSTEGWPVHGDGRSPRPRTDGADLRKVPGVLPVTVVGTDPFRLRRLIRLLSGTPGIEVVDWGLSAEPPGEDGGGLVVALHEPASPGAQLSPRQREVLAAYSASNELLDVVARRLGMNPETLKTHLRRIRAKYRAAGRPAPTRRDLYVRAVEDGLLPPPG